MDPPSQRTQGMGGISLHVPMQGHLGRSGDFRGPVEHRATLFREERQATKPLV